MQQFYNITTVAEAYSCEEANKYLAIKWTLINTISISSSNSSQDVICYILGWDGSNGEAKYPTVNPSQKQKVDIGSLA
ncbi:hypothetical protein [Niameybacter massiliensis]|uniref:hypothetical protein n=1 Tax=Niameybacter massiliensis TaxID=1658108 RepID=UPI0006B5117C|nr:hypothetical protein [Niameybacter massiliensis]